MPCIQKNKLENGFISYRIQVKAKNDRTGKFEAKVMTWRKPPGINEKQCQRELQRIAYEFEDKFRKQLNGLLAIDNDITFMEFANKWLEQVKQTKSLNYYLKGRDALKKFEEFFGNKKLKDISPIDVQSFLDTMQSRQVEMKRAFLKKDLLQYVKSHYIDITNTLPKYEISRSVYHYATAGHGIRIANAHKICEALKIDFDEYFRIDIDKHHYAKETLQKFKRTLATILATAKRQRLVEHNFASRDYITPIQGYKKEVQILNDKEAIEFVKYLHEANLDPKWKASMLISIYMGTRRGETAGLEWKDIDFENKTMKIQRFVQDIVGF